MDLQKKVVASHPSVTLYLMDLSETYYNLGYQCTQLSWQDDACAWYREAIAVAERLVELDPENLDFQDRLAQAAQQPRVQALREREDATRPWRTSCGRSTFDTVSWRRRPNCWAIAARCSYPLINAARVKNLQGKPAEAVDSALEARSLSEGFPEFLVHIASQLSSAGGRVADGTPGRDRYLDLAMETLREALASGATKPSEVVADEDFTPLRQRKEFQVLVFDPAFPIDPFAPSEMNGPTPGHRQPVRSVSERRREPETLPTHEQAPRVSSLDYDANVSSRGWCPKLSSRSGSSSYRGGRLNRRPQTIPRNTPEKEIPDHGVEAQRRRLGKMAACLTMGRSAQAKISRWSWIPASSSATSMVSTLVSGTPTSRPTRPCTTSWRGSRHRPATLRSRRPLCRFRLERHGRAEWR